MKFTLHHLNFCGVLLLGALSVWQWTENRRLNLEGLSLQRIRQAQEETIAEQQQTLEGQAADLRQLQEKTRLLAEERDAAQTESERLAQENTQLTASVEQWKEAVAARDVQIEKARSQLTSLAAARDEITQKFNELAEKYNAANTRR